MDKLYSETDYTSIKNLRNITDNLAKEENNPDQEKKIRLDEDNNSFQSSEPPQNILVPID
jgi:hypothetical protein